MITVKMEQLIDFRNQGDVFDKTALPLKGAYKLNKLKKNIDTELEYYATEFQKIVDTFAQKDKDGNLKFSEDGSQILIVEDKIDECNNALDELQKLEVQIENYGLSIDDLGEDLQCTPEQLEALMPFME